MVESTVEEYVLLGAGGHAGVILDILRDHPLTPVGILDPDVRLHGAARHGIPVLGGDSLLAELSAQGVRLFALGVGSAGLPDVRAAAYERAIQTGLHPVPVRHRSAICSRTAAFGAGCQILASAIVNTNARLGTNVLVNTGAIVEHDCVVGDHSHIATGACLAGAVSVGERTHIGIGATVRQGICIGSNAVVGAGAVVVKDVPDHSVVVGVPARSLIRHE